MRLQIRWLYPPSEEEVITLQKRDTLGRTQKDETLVLTFLGAVEYSFIAIASRSTLTGNGHILTKIIKLKFWG